MGIYDKYPKFKGNRIEDTAQIHILTKMGKGNCIGHGVVIEKGVVIGDNNYIGSYTTIGTPPEFRGGTTKGKVIIGNNNVIREYVSIQAPYHTKETKIGSDNYIMNKTHIAHDCILRDFITLPPGVVLGGMVEVCSFTTFGMNSTVHPRLKIGKCCMIALGAGVTKDVPSFETWGGVPAKKIGMNTKGAEKWGLKCAD